MAKKRQQREENATEEEGFAGDDPDGNNRQSWDQTIDDKKGEVSGWLASPKTTHRHRKMARKAAVAAVESSDENAIASGDRNGSNASGGSGSIAGREVVPLVVVWWPKGR